METVDEVITELQKSGNSSNAAGMKKFAITGKIVLGVKVPEIRRISKLAGRNHRLAIELWNTEIHEARILATMIDDSLEVGIEQANRWAGDLDSWDLCDHFCGNLIVSTGHADMLLLRWIRSEKEFVKRAGFVLMAELAVRNKGADDSIFLEFLDIISISEPDGRNFVKKAVNWALRQIGKRNAKLNMAALKIAEKMKYSDDKTTRWIGSEAYRELSSEAVQRRLS